MLFFWVFFSWKSSHSIHSIDLRAVLFSDGGKTVEKNSHFIHSFDFCKKCTETNFSVKKKYDTFPCIKLFYDSKQPYIEYQRYEYSLIGMDVQDFLKIFCLGVTLLYTAIKYICLLSVFLTIEWYIFFEYLDDLSFF